MSRELIGALTQARVQMIAAQAIIDEASNECKDEAETNALSLDSQKLRRSIAVVGDVRDRYERPNPTDEVEEVATEVEELEESDNA